MISGDPNISALRGKMTEMLLKEPIKSYWMFLPCRSNPIGFLVTRRWLHMHPPPHYGEVGWDRHWGAGRNGENIVRVRERLKTKIKLFLVNIYFASWSV